MAQRGRKGKSAPVRSERKGGSAKPRFRWIALTIALPIVAVGVWWLWTNFSNRPISVVEEEPPAVVTAEASLSLRDLLEKSGVDSQRIRTTDDGAEVEWVLSPAELASRLEKHVDGSATTKGDEIVVRRADGSTERVRVRKLATIDSGAGLVEADEEEPATTNGGARIALIIDDVGFPDQPLSRVTGLGIPITFSIIPNTPAARSSAQRLSEEGFEVLCHLPMEPEGYPGVRPGAGAILTSMSDEEIVASTLASIRAVPGAVGVNNHMGSRASADPRVMKKVIEAVRTSGGYFIDSRTTPRTVGAVTARGAGVRSGSRDVFLDDDRSEAAVRAQMARLVALAEEKGLAVGIGHLYPSTVKVLTEELPRLKARGIEFVRASEAVR
jgi:polysaccharide deacetylase 2 family uncharacterized protein YibQ